MVKFWFSCALSAVRVIIRYAKHLRVRAHAACGPLVKPFFLRKYFYRITTVSQALPLTMLNTSSYVHHDPEAMLQGMRAVNPHLRSLEVPVQRSFHTRVRRHLLRHCMIGHTETSGYSVWGPTGDKLCISVPTRGHQTFRFGTRTFTCAPGQVAIFPEEEFRSTLHEGFGGYTFVTSRQHLADLLGPQSTEAGNDLRLGFEASANRDFSDFLRVVHFVGHLLNSPDQSASGRNRTLSELENLIKTALIVAVEKPVRHPASRGHVEAAKDYIYQHLSEPLSVPEIAAAAGCGVRSLQMAFQRDENTTVTDYVARVRLERAFALLSTAGDDRTVTSIALECGFSHLGRFGQKFRQVYGQTPGEVLRRG